MTRTVVFGDSGELVLITKQGRPSPFLDMQLALLEGLSRGEQAVLEGRTYSQRQAREKMSKWLK